MPRGIQRLSIENCRKEIDKHVRGLNEACKDMRQLGYEVVVHDKVGHAEVMVLVSEAYNAFTKPDGLKQSDTKLGQARN